MLVRFARFVFAAVFLALVAGPVAAVAPFDFNTAPGRLPKTVVPSAYEIDLVPNLTAKSFRGSERVVLSVRRATDRIVFNTLDLVIRDARFDGMRVVRVTTENGRQLTTLSLAHPARVGRHVLQLTYEGTIEDSAQGLFAQDYRRADGTTARMLSTQFESTDARRMFPSWDEPAFRSTFRLRAMLPANWAAISNTPVVSRWVSGHGDAAVALTTFARTPRMPSYLLVLAAGDLASIGGVGPDGTPQHVWAVRGEESEGRYTLQSAESILSYYDTYFGVHYPLAKLDHIAIPGGFGGAMENWGGITYDQNIIMHPPGATLDAKQRGFSTVAHEMAHQWNGDLVTMGWWDDIWLNESFASWMAAKATDHFNPGWAWFQAEDASKERAMNVDALASAHPIQQHVTDELQADASFDPAITYDKGQAFLRMLEAYLGEETFRAGVRAYVRAHAYSNATTADLWNALSAAGGKDIAALARGWTEQAGFPVIAVTASCDAAGARTVALTQRRFLLGASDAGNARWNVPVALATGVNGAPAYVLLSQTQRTGIPAGTCNEPLRANAGNVGYYRVAYDAATFALNRSAFGSLPDDDKIAMLDDQWALARNGNAEIATYVALAKAMGASRSARAWEQIVAALGTLERDARGTQQHDAVAAAARAVIGPLAAALGWDAKPGEPLTSEQLRHAVLAALGQWGDAGTIAEARRRFDSETLRAAMSPDLEQLAFGIVATSADAARFERLHAFVESLKDAGDAQRYRVLLMDVRDPSLAARALRIALSSEVPPQFDSRRYQMVLAVADRNPKLSWAFLRENVGPLTRGLSVFEKMLIFSSGVLAAYQDVASPEQLQAWLAANLPADAGPLIVRGIERARVDEAIKQRLNRATRSFVASVEARPA